MELRDGFLLQGNVAIIGALPLESQYERSHNEETNLERVSVLCTEVPCASFAIKGLRNVHRDVDT